MALSKAEVFKAIENSTSKAEREMLWQRIKRLQRTVAISLQSKTIILLEKNQWSEDTIKKELSGCYGMTYAKLFYDKYVAQ